MTLLVTVEITVVEFRRLNSFEWAVLTMLKTFGEDAPSITEASTQLCIGEPAFLVAALENVRVAGLVRPRADELRQSDLKDFELSEMGVTALREEGWEFGHEQALSDSIQLDWPSLKLRPHTHGGRHAERKQPAPPLDEVQLKLKPEKLEDWLNHNDNSRCWRVKSFNVLNVEG